MGEIEQQILEELCQAIGPDIAPHVLNQAYKNAGFSEYDPKIEALEKIFPDEDDVLDSLEDEDFIQFHLVNCKLSKNELSNACSARTGSRSNP